MSDAYENIADFETVVEESAEGAINYNAKPDYTSNVKAKNDASNALYPYTNDLDGTHYPGDFAFMLNKPENRQFHEGLSEYPEVLVNLGGQFSDIAAIFHGDEIQQQTAVKAQIVLGGVTLQFKKIEVSEHPSGDLIPIQATGKSVHHAYCTMPPGYYVQLIPPLPSEARADRNPAKRGTARTPLKPIPYIPKNIATIAQHNLHHYLVDDVKYKKGMGSNYITTDAMLMANEGFCNSALTCGLLMMYALGSPHTNIRPNNANIPHPHVLDINFAPNGAAIAHGNEPDLLRFNEFYNLNTNPANPTSTLLTRLNALAVALGVVELGSDTLPGVTLTEKRMSQYKDVRLRLLRTMFPLADTTGKIPLFHNVEYGFNSVTLKNEHGKHSNGNIKTDTCTGRMIQNQFQHFPRCASAFANMVHLELSFVHGKIVKGAAGPKSTFSLIK